MLTDKMRSYYSDAEDAYWTKMPPDIVIIISDSFLCSQPVGTLKIPKRAAAIT